MSLLLISPMFDETYCLRILRLPMNGSMLQFYNPHLDFISFRGCLKVTINE